MNTVKPGRVEMAQNDAEQQATALTPVVIATRIFNILVPLFFLLFTWKHAVAFVYTLRISNLIVVFQTVLLLQLFVRRHTAPFISTSAYAWLIALCGTIAPLLFRPMTDGADFSIATLLQVMGLGMQIYVISTLNGSVESTVAKRGLARDGLYRFVRHPLYLALIFSQYGYVLNHSTVYNVFVCALAILFQLLRVCEEERLLREDEAFQDYVEQTRWRVVPGMF